MPHRLLPVRSVVRRIWSHGQPQRHIRPRHIWQTLPGNGGHKGLQLLGLIGTREGPAHIAGSISNVGAHAAGTPLLLVGQRLQDHGDNWAQETKQWVRGSSAPATSPAPEAGTVQPKATWSESKRSEGKGKSTSSNQVEKFYKSCPQMTWTSQSGFRTAQRCLGSAGCGDHRSETTSPLARSWSLMSNLGEENPGVQGS